METKETSVLKYYHQFTYTGITTHDPIPNKTCAMCSIKQPTMHYVRCVTKTRGVTTGFETRLFPICPDCLQREFPEMYLQAALKGKV